ncbi:hypothetical protein FE257_001334 [Aspergillus nanangensis]|uniref:Uncharacterized protein n=1 Tax=Aspergillus nanangensis TaxID=2582783 RepID=A0AAD4CDY9_ASPNN|nr:hypothetical protein FE257_001334 [Aspergillus nanangensis]
MCGPSRPSSGNRIAIMFHPSAAPITSSYSLSFRETDSSQTKAVFRIDDSLILDHFQTCTGIDLRIERHGDLTSKTSHPPLHRFKLRRSPEMTDCDSAMEFDLPERLDLGISDTGIVGRQVTVTMEGSSLVMGRGIVGFD